MRWAFLCVAGVILFESGPVLASTHLAAHEAEVSLYGSPFKVSGLQFTIPERWLVEPVENGNRAGQWHIPPPRGQEGEGGEVVVFYFGPGIGGSAKENMDAWMNSVLTDDGQPTLGRVNSQVVNGSRISQVTLFGAYQQAAAAPGLPPLVKPKYGLFGAVIESPQGNIYCRFTGPDALIKADLPLFNKILSTVKPQDKVTGP